MISIQLPDLAQHPLALTPDTRRRVRRERGWDDVGGPLERRLAVGGPWTCPLQPGSIRDDELDDPDTRRFLEVEASRSDFYLVHLACSFLPPEGEPIHRASIEIKLERHGGPPPPIAWSMQPRRLTTAAPMSLELKLNASLKILGVGVEGAVSSGAQPQFEPVFLQAAFEGLPNPRWDFRATPTIAIEGVHRLALVVAAPAGSVAHGTATLRAAITRKRFGLLTYTAALPGGAPLEFVLPG